MEYTGLVRKYPVDRPLTDQERTEQLRQKQRLEVEPAYQLSVIRMNSTFMEVVDKYFAWKGVPTMVCLVGGGMIVVTVLWLFISVLMKQGEMVKAWPAFLAIFLMLIPFLVFIWWAIRKESFAYTHYPIRLNRKTRMVHVFRPNGTVLSVPWDEVFFCIGRASAANWEIQGHILAADRKTVQETFAFMFLVDRGETELLKQYWEFLRRYMEDGPKSVVEYVKICLPIKDQRETFWFGFHRAHSFVGSFPLPFQLFGLLFHLVYAPGRWFSMRTSKIPVWPKEIEEQCVIEPNDPYIREASMNPE